MILIKEYLKGIFENILNDCYKPHASFNDRIKCIKCIRICKNCTQFGAVVESNGKIVTGKIKRIHGFMKMTNSSKWTGRGYYFYHTYLIPARNNKAVDRI